jgi:tripartite ATP-independent transporter DctP family solute receptor
MRSPRFFQLLLASSSCALLLSACTGDAPGPQRLILANVHAAGYPTADALRHFAEAVAQEPALTEGTGRTGVTVDLQLAGVLGNEKEMLEKLRFGALGMACSSVAPLTEFSPTIGVLTLPYLFRDPEHFWAVLEGEIGAELLAALEAEAGFVGLAWYDAGARSFYNRVRPVRTLADLEGLKIRVQKAETMRSMVSALGGAPVALGFKEVYTNLHTGALDGAENNLPSYRSERHFEVARYYSLDRHSMVPDLLMIRREAWEKLTPEAQTALRRAAEASAREQRRLWHTYTEAALATVREAGAEIHEIEDPEAFRAAVAPLYAALGDRYGDLVERIRAVP